MTDSDFNPGTSLRYIVQDVLSQITPYGPHSKTAKFLTTDGELERVPGDEFARAIAARKLGSAKTQTYSEASARQLMKRYLLDSRLEEVILVNRNTTIKNFNELLLKPDVQAKVVQ